MKFHPNYGNYAILWFALGLLYSWVASINRSFRFALLAALAGNFGIWALLYNADLSFFSHPQVWMIPLALIVLVSEHINRKKMHGGKCGLEEFNLELQPELATSSLKARPGSILVAVREANNLAHLKMVVEKTWR